MEPLPLRKQLGNTAEQAAYDHYSREGARLIARNYNVNCGELDLVFEDLASAELVVVEVRARTPGLAWETPAESLTPAKLRRIRNATELFLLEYRGTLSSLRFDLAAWDATRPEGLRLEILRNFWWY